MKISRFILAVALLILIVGGCGINEAVQTNEVRQQESNFRMQDISSLKVNGEIGEISVHASQGEEIMVKFEASDRFDLVERTSENQLNLTINYQGHWNLFGRRNRINWNPFTRNDEYEVPKLEIFLPEFRFESVQINNEVGTIRMGDLSVQKLNVSSRVGEVVLTNNNAELTRIETNVGRIRINHHEGDLFAKSDVGEIRVDLEIINQNISLETSIGAISLDVNRTPENATIKAETDLGRSRIFGENSNREVFGTGDFQVGLSSSIGEITVR